MHFPFTFTVPTLAGAGPEIELIATFGPDPVDPSDWALETILDDDGNTLSRDPANPVAKHFFEAVLASLLTQKNLVEIDCQWSEVLLDEEDAEAERYYESCAEQWADVRHHD